MRRVAILALMLASLAPIDFGFAQGEDQSQEPPIAANTITQLIYGRCAQIWEIKDAVALAKFTQASLAFLSRAEPVYLDRIKAADDMIARAKKEVERFQTALDQVIAAEVAGAPPASEKPAIIKGLHEAEAHLQQERGRAAQAHAFIKSLPLITRRIQACAEDQLVYIEGKQPAQQQSDVSAGFKISGRWNAQCTKNFTGETFEHSGTFIFNLDPQSENKETGVSQATGTFDHGKGTLPLTGTLSRGLPGATVKSASLVVWVKTTFLGNTWSLVGEVAESQGEYISAGDVTGFFGNPQEGGGCRGKYNGTQTN
jgi:hypothetical protein